MDHAFLSSLEVSGDLLYQRPYAAIDLGTNTCRLLVVQRRHQVLETLDVFSRFTRLGEGLSRHGRLSNEAIGRTLETLRQCAQKLRFHAPIGFRAITTEAVRRASNRDYFLNQVHTQTGLTLEVIDQQEEAKLALKGCANLLDSSYPYAIVFDIGGGSTEVMWICQSPTHPPVMQDYVSLPYGVVTLSEDYHTDHAADYRSIRQLTAQALEDFTQRNNILSHIHHHRVQILGTSGTATTAVALNQGLKRYEKSRIDGMIINFSEIQDVIKVVQMMSESERQMNRCIGNGRGDLVLGGLAILEGICDLWPIGEMTVADRGVREGIAAELAFGRDHFYSYVPAAKVETAA